MLPSTQLEWGEYWFDPLLKKFSKKIFQSIRNDCFIISLFGHSHVYFNVFLNSGTDQIQSLKVPISTFFVASSGKNPLSITPLWTKQNSCFPNLFSSFPTTFPNQNIDSSFPIYSSDNSQAISFSKLFVEHILFYLFHQVLFNSPPNLLLHLQAKMSKQDSLLLTKETFTVAQMSQCALFCNLFMILPSHWQHQYQFLNQTLQDYNFIRRKFFRLCDVIRANYSNLNALYCDFGYKNIFFGKENESLVESIGINSLSQLFYYSLLYHVTPVGYSTPSNVHSIPIDDNNVIGMVGGLSELFVVLKDGIVTYSVETLKKKRLCTLSLLSCVLKYSMDTLYILGYEDELNDDDDESKVLSSSTSSFPSSSTSIPKPQLNQYSHIFSISNSIKKVKLESPATCFSVNGNLVFVGFANGIIGLFDFNKTCPIMKEYISVPEPITNILCTSNYLFFTTHSDLISVPYSNPSEFCFYKSRKSVSSIALYDDCVYISYPSVHNFVVEYFTFFHHKWHSQMKWQVPVEIESIIVYGHFIFCSNTQKEFNNPFIPVYKSKTIATCSLANLKSNGNQTNCVFCFLGQGFIELHQRNLFFGNKNSKSTDSIQPSLSIHRQFKCAKNQIMYSFSREILKWTGETDFCFELPFSIGNSTPGSTHSGTHSGTHSSHTKVFYDNPPLAQGLYSHLHFSDSCISGQKCTIPSDSFKKWISNAFLSGSQIIFDPLKMYFSVNKHPTEHGLISAIHRLKQSNTFPSDQQSYFLFYSLFENVAHSFIQQQWGLLLKQYSGKSHSIIHIGDIYQNIVFGLFKYFQNPLSIPIEKILYKYYLFLPTDTFNKRLSSQKLKDTKSPKPFYTIPLITPDVSPGKLPQLFHTVSNSFFNLDRVKISGFIAQTLVKFPHSFCSIEEIINARHIGQLWIVSNFSFTISPDSPLFATFLYITASLNTQLVVNIELSHQENPVAIKMCIDPIHVP